MDEDVYDNTSLLASSVMMTSTSISQPPTSSPDAATYIARHLGAQHLPLTTIIPISVVYAIIFVLGVLGNVSTICVVLKNKYMHTPTNVYLANLAISDLLTHLVGKCLNLLNKTEKSFRNIAASQFCFSRSNKSTTTLQF
jgi:hypothetical protein